MARNEYIYARRRRCRNEVHSRYAKPDRVFIADLAASVLFGAVAFLRRRNAVSSALEGWAICAGLIIVSAAAFLCGISMGRYFDTAELLIAGAGAFIGAFCMKQVCGSAKKEEPVNE